jgi:hypothetical protein
MVPDGGVDFSSFYFSTLDIDSNGNGDFVVHLRGEILAFLNRGDGTFAEPIRSIAGTDSVYPRAAVDVQGDGNADLITQNDLSFNPVQGVHLGNGDGTFGGFEPFSAPVPYSFLLAGDVDGDGRVDLVVGDYTRSSLVTLVGDPVERFGEQRSTQVNVWPIDGELGDLDEDGDLDLALTAFDGSQDSISVWSNDGTGRFVRSDAFAYAEPLADVRGLELADFDLDGRADIAFTAQFANESLRAFIAARDPGDTGRFLAAEDVLQVPGLVYGPDVLDLDADGDPELVLHEPGRILIYENRFRAGSGAPAFDFTPSGVSATAFLEVHDRISVLHSAVSGTHALLARVTVEDCLEPTSQEIVLLGAQREPRSRDCDANGVPDECDADCNHDSAPDACLAPPPPRCPSAPGDCTPDCNSNGVGDACDIAEGRSLDSDTDGIPDECQSPQLAFVFDGPLRIRGKPGSEVTGEFACQVIPGVELFGSADGVQGWSVAFKGEGVEVTDATDRGTAGALRCVDPAGSRATNGFRTITPARDQGVSGVVAAFVLSFTRPVTLPLDRAHPLLRFTVRARLGPEPEVRMARLVYQDGLRGAGTPVRNTVTRRGVTLFPTQIPFTVELSSLQYEFLRGDANTDGGVDISDGIHTLQNLFIGGRRGSCRDAADFNDSGAVDISDAIGTFQNLFLGGPPPAPPGRFECGEDPTPDDLGCNDFPACP